MHGTILQEGNSVGGYRIIEDTVVKEPYWGEQENINLEEKKQD